MPMAQRQGRECADCLGNRRLERRLSLRRAKKHAFHGRGKLLLVGVMRQQKLSCGPLCPRQHCPTAWKSFRPGLFHGLHAITGSVQSHNFPKVKSSQVKSSQRL